MRARSFAALVLVVAGGVGAFAIYSFGWHESSSPPESSSALTPKTFTAMAGSERLFTIRYGDVIRFPGAETLCQATGEGGQPELFCVHSKKSRFHVVFNRFGVRVFDLRPPNDGFVFDYALPAELVLPVKACGTIRALDRRLLVDIAEGKAVDPCNVARGVMRRFLSRFASQGARSEFTTSIRAYGRQYDCYRSRPDGVGWDFHCARDTGSAESDYVDIGAGRR